MPQFGRHKQPGRQVESDPAHPRARAHARAARGRGAGRGQPVHRRGRRDPDRARCAAAGPRRMRSVCATRASLRTTPRSSRASAKSLIVHRAGAASPTLVNGRAIERAPIRAGDRIQIGAHGLRGALARGHRRSRVCSRSRRSSSQPAPPPARVETATTEIRRALPPPAALVVLRGIDDLEGAAAAAARAHEPRRAPSRERDRARRSRAYRASTPSWSGRSEQLIFAHMSQINPSYVDGERVEERVPLRGGETIQLADRVALRIEIGDADPRARAAKTSPRIRRRRRSAAVVARGDGREAAPRRRDRARLQLHGQLPRPRRRRLARDEGGGEAARIHHRVVRALPRLREPGGAGARGSGAQQQRRRADVLLRPTPSRPCARRPRCSSGSASSTRARTCSGGRSACGRASTAARRSSTACAASPTARCSTSRAPPEARARRRAARLRRDARASCRRTMRFAPVGEVGKEKIAAYRLRSVRRGLKRRRLRGRSSTPEASRGQRDWEGT